MQAPLCPEFSTALHGAGNLKFVKDKAFSRATLGARLTIREWRIGKRFGLHLLGFLVTVSLLAFLGPFGTWGDLSFLDRLVFWSIAVGVNWLCAQVVFTFTIRRFLARGWPPAVGVVLAGLTSALPGTGAVWVVVAAYRGYRPFTLSALVELYVEVAVIQLVVGFLVSYFIERSFERRAAALASLSDGRQSDGMGPAHGDSGNWGASFAGGEPDAAASASALLARLPANKRGDLRHLRMQDHYVEIHTDKGMEMVLLRFRDALREIEDVDGMQVHRSHWVARAAVDGVERHDGRVTLRLVNGNRVPVSRSFTPALRAGGWI